MYGADKVIEGKALPHHLVAGGTSPCFPGRYSPNYRPQDSMRRCMTNPPVSRPGIPQGSYGVANPHSNNVFGLYPQGNIFSSLDDGFLSRAEVLGTVDMSKNVGASSNSNLCHLKSDMMYHPGTINASVMNARPQVTPNEIEGFPLLDPISVASSSMVNLNPMTDSVTTHCQLPYSHMNSIMPHSCLPHCSMQMHDVDSDPRELEAFAERFKQRRIKLGVTQADVGKTLASLKLPGVGALSQSTICRFESLTLSHNNMVALKPILLAWLEEAEAQAKSKRRDPEAPSVLPCGEKKRKRTSIAAPEKRSLEAYFAVQPRPSGEKIAAIAEKLDLKKNVVRVWFCNQRQKQKRMKFAAQHH